MSEAKSPGIALVTGSSSGIGAAFAKALAARGYGLIVVARRRERLETLAESLRRERGIAVEVLVADLSDAAELRRVERRVAEEERLTMLVNNAGLGGIKPFLDTDHDYLRAMIAVNVTALTLLTYAALPGMLRRSNPSKPTPGLLGTLRGGTVINVASGLGFVRLPGTAVYGATKAFVTQFTRTLHEEYGGHGIRFQALLPGLTRTELGSGQNNVSFDHLPPDKINTPEQAAEESLAGLEMGELVCIPGLENLEEWARADHATQEVMQTVSSGIPAERYRRFLPKP
jgi:hypothetical protein